MDTSKKMTQAHQESDDLKGDSENVSPKNEIEIYIEKRVEVKDVIELDLGVNGQMDDVGDYDNQLTESDADKGSEFDEDEVSNDDEVAISGDQSQLSSTAEKRKDCSNGDSKSDKRTVSGSGMKGSRASNTQRGGNNENVSFTNPSAKEQVHSMQVDSEVNLEYVSLTGDIFDKDSIVNTLFTKSPVPHDKSESSEIQVTIFLPDNQSVTKFYPANSNISEVKKSIGEMIDLEAEKFMLSLMGSSIGEYIDDWMPLLNILPNSVGGLIFNLNFNLDEEGQFPNVVAYAPLITVRQVYVEDKEGREKVVTVVTEDVIRAKEWLGGFRNIKTGVMYHNASTETHSSDKKVESKTPVKMTSRDSQTHLPYTNKFTQVNVEKSTQMWLTDQLLQVSSNKTILAKPYIEFDQRTEQQEKADSILKIQRWYRRQVSKRNMRRAFSKLIQLIRKQREKRAAAEASLTHEKILNLVNVAFSSEKTNYFNLYSLIGMWWKKEYNDISKIQNISERRAAYYDLLQIEVDLLSALERQKIKNTIEVHHQRDLKLVEETAKPLIMHQDRRYPTVVETLDVQRAQNIKEIYMTYIRTDLDKNERIEMLKQLVNTVETFQEVDYTRDLIKLMRREIDLMSMGLEDVYLRGLKKRIEEGLFHFVRDKDFNPQVKNFKTILYPKINQRSYRCKGCRKLKLPADFPIHVRLTSYKNCKSCEWKQQTAHKVLNIAPYASVLKLLRAKEIVKSPDNKYCFALQPFGAYFIINTIWNAKSALSEATTLSELRLCRWDNKQVWSPWNNILLTVEEAEVHERISDITEVYEDDFIQAINMKHIATKFHFKVLDETESYIKEASTDSTVDDNIYQQMFHRKGAKQPVDWAFKPPLSRSISHSQTSRQLSTSSRSKSKLKSKLY